MGRAEAQFFGDAHKRSTQLALLGAVFSVAARLRWGILARSSSPATRSSFPPVRTLLLDVVASLCDAAPLFHASSTAFPAAARAFGSAWAKATTTKVSSTAAAGAAIGAGLRALAQVLVTRRSAYNAVAAVGLISATAATVVFRVLYAPNHNKDSTMTGRLFGLAANVGVASVAIVAYAPTLSEAFTRDVALAAHSAIGPVIRAAIVAGAGEAEILASPTYYALEAAVVASRAAATATVLLDESANAADEDDHQTQVRVMLVAAGAIAIYVLRLVRIRWRRTSPSSSGARRFVLAAACLSPRAATLLTAALGLAARDLATYVTTAHLGMLALTAFTTGTPFVCVAALLGHLLLRLHGLAIDDLLVPSK